MRALRLALLSFTVLALLAGCIQSSGSSANVSQSCNDGACQVCYDGTCADCQPGAECQDCMDGECAAFGRAAAAAHSAQPQDVDIQETHDLTLGMQDTTWSFDVAPGATGHIHLYARDVVTHKLSLGANICVHHDVEGPTFRDEGSKGSNCDGGNTQVTVSGSTSDHPYPVLVWDELHVAHYTLTAKAQPQANELVVDIHVDQPPNGP